MTTENKIKFNLRPSIGDKTPPPTKLLINHGKPNFTINRSGSKSNYNMFSKLNKNENGVNKHNHQHNDVTNEFPKIILKKSQSSTLPSSLINKNSKDHNKIEFLEKRKQIYDKIEKENTTEVNGYMNKIENGSGSNVTTSTITSTSQNNYVRKMSERIQNGSFMKSPPSPSLSPSAVSSTIAIHQSIEYGGVHHQQSNVQNGVGNVIEKPIIPSKINLINGNNNANKNDIPFPPPPPPELFSSAISVSSSSSSTLNEPSNPSNGLTNFEQKTIVSFSKDLASEPNKYPETIKVIKNIHSNGGDDAFNNNDEIIEKHNEVLQELTKLKFDIKVKEDDVDVKPVIIQ